MAQAFVNRSELQNETAANPVRVIAAYRNDQVVDRSWHGTQCTVLAVADDKIVRKDADPVTPTILSPIWRDDFKTVVNGEAYRRIQDVFPQFKQMNYNAQYNQNQATHGIDPTTWPDQAFVAEYNRGWNYIAAVRTTANSFTGMPVDPTDDSIWPPIINPIA